MRKRVMQLVVSTAALGGAAGLALGPGCGGETTQQRSPATAVAEDARSGDEDGDDAHGDAGYTMSGPYRCCAPGTGTACCAGTRQGTCFEFGGIYKDCRKAGEQYEGKVICAHCCPGLTRAAIVVPGNQVPSSADHLPEGCDDVAPPSLGVCIQCGDGICGPGESFCNCEQDCPRPDDAG